MNDKLKAFLSHSSKEKRLASNLKDIFASFGIDVFVAHRDIEPSVEWQQRILQELRSCDVFLALLTENFMKSDWTDQESGIALYLKKLVIPIEVAMKPYGFMARKQAHLLNLRNLRDSCTQMGKAIDGATRLRTRFRHNLIQAFVGGRGSNSLIAAFFMIDTLQGFTATQVNDIVTAAYQDNRSEKSKVFKKHAGHFIERNRRKISTVNLRRIDRQ